MTTGDRNDRGQFTKGNRAALKHGGEAALERLQNGQPFDGLALAAYQGVIDELGVNLDALTGVDRVRVKRAARFEAVARLFDGAALSAAAVGDLDRWERYNQRAGWIGDKAFRALGTLRQKVGGGDALDYEEILARQRASND